MENDVLKMAIQQGLWAVLFVVLLFYILKEQEKRDKKSEQREGKYQEIINKLTDKLSVIENVSQDVKEIKNKIFK